jgi:hypothetical protein
MTINAGEVRATYTGDASGIRAASEQARKALADTGDTAKATAAKLKAADEQSRALASANKAAAAAADTHAAGLGRVREGIEKARGTMGAFSQLTGAASSQLGAFGGVLQGVIGSFAAGGALGAGLSLVTTGIGFAADKFDVFGVKAKKAAEDAAKHLAGIRSEVDALIDALNSAGGAKLEFEVDALDRQLADKRAQLDAAIPEGAGALFRAYQNSASFRDESQIVEPYRKAREIALDIEAIEAKRHYTANAIAKLEIDAAEEKLKREIAAQERAGKVADELSAKLSASLHRLSERATIIDGGGMSRGMAPSRHFDGIGRAEAIGDKIGAAFGQKGVGVLARALGGDLSGALSAAAGLAGAAAGIPFAGEIAGALLKVAEQVAGIFMRAGEHMADMLSRPIGAMFSKGGAGRIGSMLGQLGGDMQRTAKTGTDMLPIMALMGPAGLGLAGPVAGAMQQQALASVASFAFSLTTANAKFEKFTDVIGQAGTVILDAFAPIWGGLMPLAGAVVQLAEAFAPVIEALVSLVPFHGALELMINAMKAGALAIVTAGQYLFTAYMLIAANMIKLQFDLGQITEEERNRALARMNSTMDEINGAATAIADITVSSAERAAMRTEREAARQAAIEKAKERAALRAADALERVSEGAENLPAGYRVEGATYRASDSQAAPTTNVITAIQSMTINYNGAGDGPRGIQGIAESIRRRAWSASQWASVGRLSIVDLRN